MRPGTEELAKQHKQDGWINLLAGLGRQHDKSQYTEYGASPILHKEMLTSLWNGEGLASRVVSVVAEDMTRAWITLPEDASGKLDAELKRIKAKPTFYEAMLWQRLYGGAIVVIGTPEAESLEEPMPAKPKGITFLKCYPKARVDILSADLIMDPRSPNFEEVAYYQVRRTDGMYFRVHHSRVLLFRGQPYADDSDGVNWEDRYWGMSALQQPWEQIKTLGSTYQAVSNLLQEFTISIYTLSNLAQLLAEGNEAAILNRVNVIASTKSMINGVLLGEGEAFNRETASIAGLPDTLDRFMSMASAVTGIPVTRLFGRSAAGMNATGENDMQQYYDKVQSEQETKLGAPIQLLLNLIGSYIGGTKIPVPFEFAPIWTPTQQELISMRKQQADTDKLYIDAGVLNAEEVRESRFANGYGFDTAIDPEATIEEPEE
jgi:phage-related protein (TIGR01555 family)